MLLESSTVDIRYVTRKPASVPKGVNTLLRKGIAPFSIYLYTEIVSQFNFKL
jgi:hypothetical protein